MNIANQEKHGDDTYTIIFKGENERFLIACLSDEKQNLIECYIRDTNNFLFFEPSDDEKKTIEKFLFKKKIKHIFTKKNFIYEGMSSVLVFEDIKNMTEISNELFEELSIYLEDNKKHSKKKEFHKRLDELLGRIKNAES